MDGSSRSCPRKTGIGGLLEYLNGCILVLFSGPIGEGDAVNTELWAIENGLEIFANSGWVWCKQLVIEYEPMLSFSW
ncbi:hypothetical protein CXB51_010047 [Gossypium anomalum]|uniref:RNase H type-1 domain-containing protein n=1 Tax=Gossypium anomalum TaxID=47600 RepID=A0A8J5Z2E1_9ROSI|nr:hypothetical protein CXB51_010047 [Gossypium anomalum]